MKKIILLTTTLLLTGCVTRTPAIYDWGSYEANIKESILAADTNNIDTQIDNLLFTLQQSETSNKKPPPGLYAHLGLLYDKKGDSELMRQYLKKESEPYPESGHYISFILSQSAKA